MEGLTLAKPIKKPNYSYETYIPKRKTIQPVVAPVKFKRRQQKKQNPFRSLVLLGFTFLFFAYVSPFAFYNFIQPVFIGGTNDEIKIDYKDLYSPTSNYLNNDSFLGVNSLKAAEEQNPQMQKMYEAGQMPVLTSKLLNLMKLYPTIQPAVYVWDFETGRTVNINASSQFPVASIIKIPVLLELFRSIEQGQLNLRERMILTEYYRSGGSGGLQFSQGGRAHSIDNLARVMIEDSDNTATNMLMSKVGGMVDINRAVRHWGLKQTYVSNWLPDLGGTNVSTAKDIATMLYNVDNAQFLSLKSRERIVDYMNHVKNNRLIQAGLPSDAIFMHKTGDIGTMLGDAGIVWSSNGKKYIVVILAKRPFNSPQGKDFIVKASSIIYDSIVHCCN